MAKDRSILHSDLNSFYASVEMLLDPSLRGKAVAVCGSTEDRHGIVLAKSELAKRAGVKTGMVNWEARQKCPGLIMVPPQYERYLHYSQLTRSIYQRYTDQVEPYGMDECWLDVSGSTSLYGQPLDIARKISRSIKAELGLTVSIGVSFNKIFAKLGSDMKKPDAITVITRENYQEKIWPLPAKDLIFVGRATSRKLARYGIRSIGALAGAPFAFLQQVLGKNGEMLWAFANGLDQARVMPLDFVSPIKSIGHGTTCRRDLHSEYDVWRVILHLSQDIGHRLRVHQMGARGVQLTIKDSSLASRQHQMPLPLPSQSPSEIARSARQLFLANYKWCKPVRALTVRAINLVSRTRPQQLVLFDDIHSRIRQEQLDDTIDELRERFGKRSVLAAVLLEEPQIANDGANDVIMPGLFFV